MEICKQLFDVALLFDIVGDLSVTAETLNKFAMVELQYRGENPDAIQKVLDNRTGIFCQKRIFRGYFFVFMTLK